MPKPQYGKPHQRRRAKLLPLAYGTPCLMCGEVMVKGQRLDLDHSTPHALGGGMGDRIVHSSCNRSAGARLGNALKRMQRQNNAFPSSRQW